jgi:hypothetical protein
MTAAERERQAERVWGELQDRRRQEEGSGHLSRKGRVGELMTKDDRAEWTRQREAEIRGKPLVSMCLYVKLLCVDDGQLLPSLHL